MAQKPATLCKTTAQRPATSCNPPPTAQPVSQVSESGVCPTSKHHFRYYTHVHVHVHLCATYVQPLCNVLQVHQVHTHVMHPRASSPHTCVIHPCAVHPRALFMHPCATHHLCPLYIHPPNSTVHNDTASVSTPRPTARVPYPVSPASIFRGAYKFPSAQSKHILQVKNPPQPVWVELI